jgi:phosphopantothenoylcysteine synthetase/decarboxylase
VPAYLALVACGSPLAAEVHEIAAYGADVGWEVRVVATPSALAWINAAAVERVTGFRPLVDQRQPGQVKRFPTPSRVLVCPATFNSVNKLAAGIMDTYAAGVLCEALASHVPMTIVPMVGGKLWGHPVWDRNLAALTAAGVTFVDVRTGRAGELTPVESGTGPAVSEAFDPAWVLPAPETRSRVPRSTR